MELHSPTEIDGKVGTTCCLPAKSDSAHPGSKEGLHPFLYKVVGQISVKAENIELVYPLPIDEVLLSWRSEDRTLYPQVSGIIMEACLQVPLWSYVVAKTESYGIGIVNIVKAEDMVVASGIRGAEEGAPGDDGQIEPVFSIWLIPEEGAGNEHS